MTTGKMQRAQWPLQLLCRVSPEANALYIDAVRSIQSLHCQEAIGRYLRSNGLQMLFPLFICFLTLPHWAYLVIRFVISHSIPMCHF